MRPAVQISNGTISLILPCRKFHVNSESIESVVLSFSVMSDVYFSLFVHAILAEDCLDFSFGQITMEKIKQMFFCINDKRQSRSEKRHCLSKMLTANCLKSEQGCLKDGRLVSAYSCRRLKVDSQLI